MHAVNAKNLTRSCFCSFISKVKIADGQDGSFDCQSKTTVWLGVAASLLVNGDLLSFGKLHEPISTGEDLQRPVLLTSTVSLGF